MSAQTTFDGVSDNGDVGRHAVTVACERWPLTPLGDGGDAPDWCDAEFSADLEAARAGVIATEGTPVEVKACRYRYEGQYGRWWIQRANHEELLASAGEYVLAVYDRADGSVLRQGLVSASTVDAIVDGNWWDCGDGGRAAQEYRQISWTTVFDDVGGEGDA